MRWRELLSRHHLHETLAMKAVRAHPGQTSRPMGQGRESNMTDDRREVTLRGRQGRAELVNGWNWKEMDPCPMPSPARNPGLVEELNKKCKTWNF